ncbi:hypothetical protein MTCD1_03264 [Colwellia marinimaniae]|uniref:Uncharacterized protein n=1 Tax=Colwellia marinimaniae TaxID=1513592 RepID=A0ABQ0MZ28_9GAMM|nr:hypothetical protein MTCD1_03264 [Colwellia marinimaniae]
MDFGVPAVLQRFSAAAKQNQLEDPSACLKFLLPAG